MIDIVDVAAAATYPLRSSVLAFYLACGARADTRPYIDEVTGLLDHRVVFVIDDHPAPT